MHNISAEELDSLVRRILLAAGADERNASRVAEALVSSNLSAVDTHGVFHLPGYVSHIRDGQLVPTAWPEIVQETPNTALVKGNWTFGHVVAKYTMEVAIRKARERDRRHSQPCAGHAHRAPGGVRRAGGLPGDGGLRPGVRLRRRGAGGRPLRRSRARAAHEPDLHRIPSRRGADVDVRLRHNGRRRLQDPDRAGPGRSDPAGLVSRRGRESNDRSLGLPGEGRASALRGAQRL